MSLLIIKPGLLDSVQDLGRMGHAYAGINPGGAMDHFAVKLANMLVGNPADEGIMEIHFPGPQILFEQDALVCITGADFSPTCNDAPLPCWRPVLIRKNTLMQFHRLKWGARAYLAVQGGFQVEKWLDSYSTNLKAGAGGWKGRRLERKDELFFREDPRRLAGLWRGEDNFQLLPWRPDIGNVYHEPHAIYFIKGHEWNSLSDSSREKLHTSGFIIQPASDRMGYQLNGAPLTRTASGELISSAVSYGTIQLLPGGQLIILMADHQTTGGYPRIGHVITAHLPKLAQLRPGETIQLRPVCMEAAEALLFSRHQELQIMKRACTDHLNRLYAYH